MTHPPTETALPLTRLIAERVVGLRKQRGLSQEELARLVSEEGPNWTRSSVVKLENKRREALTVQELLALCVVFDVPMVWMIAWPGPDGWPDIDYESEAMVPITASRTMPPWMAALWLAGRFTLHYDKDANWESMSFPLAAAYELASRVEYLERSLELRDQLGAIASQDEVAARDHQYEAQDRREVEQIGRLLRGIFVYGNFDPGFSGVVADRAMELGIDLKHVRADPSSWARYVEERLKPQDPTKSSGG